MIDPAGHRLIHRLQRYKIAGYLASSTDSPTVLEVSTPPEYGRLLEEFPDLMHHNFKITKPKHGIELPITTVGPPVHAQTRWLAPDKYRAAKRAFEDMEASGIVRRSRSTWFSGLLLVPKSDGGLRPCGDFRHLNAKTKMDRYPIPNIMDLSNTLAGNIVFSKVDLVKGYHQILVAEVDIPKTAVTTPFGLYEFVRMPFRLKNVAQTFQRLIDSVLQGLPYVYAYLDDIIIASQTPEQHFAHMRTVFECLRQSNLVINPRRCIFAAQELEFLGHQVTKWGILPLPDKVKAIQELPKPKTVEALQEFSGMINFYCHFLPQAANTSLKHFQYYVEGRNFTIFTDHKPLVGAMTKASPLPLACQQRHLAYISAFTTDLQHMSGKDNTVADCLSRPSCMAASVRAPELMLDTIAHEQETDVELPLYKTSITGLQVGRHTLSGPKGPVQVWCDSSQSEPWPIVPTALRRTVFKTYHALTHPSSRATVQLVARAYVWHGMRKNILRWSRECLNSQ